MPTLPESPGYDTNLPVSRTGHHISRIKSSFELFCALVWDLAHFSSKLEFFLFVVRFLGHFCTYLVTDKDYFWHQRWSRILMVCTSRETSHITFWCGFLSLRGVVSSLLLEINKNGICSLFTGKYNFGVVPEWAGAFAPYFLTPPWDFLYERTAPTSGVIVCYPITDTSRFWMCQTICGMVLCQAFLSLLPLPSPPFKISSPLAP